MGLGYPVHGPGHRFADTRAGVFRYASDGSFEERRLRNHVGRGAGHQMCNGQHCRVEHVDLAGHSSLQRGDDRSGGRDGVGGVMGSRCMAASAGDGDGDRGVAGQQRSGPAAGGTDPLVGADMEGKCPVYAIQHALVDHDPGASEALLAGLEHEADPPLNLVPPGRQDPGGTNQHRRVSVMATGMGPTLDRRLEVQAGVLGHGERIGVGSQ